jgi:hypothetical protein
MLRPPNNEGEIASGWRCFLFSYLTETGRDHFKKFSILLCHPFPNPMALGAGFSWSYSLYLPITYFRLQAFYSAAFGIYESLKRNPVSFPQHVLKVLKTLGSLSPSFHFLQTFYVCYSICRVFLVVKWALVWNGMTTSSWPNMKVRNLCSRNQVLQAIPDICLA